MNDPGRAARPRDAFATLSGAALVLVLVGSEPAHRITPSFGVFLGVVLCAAAAIGARRLARSRRAAPAVPADRPMLHLLPGIGRQLRTPLNGIIGMAEHALAVEDVPVAARARLEMMHSTAEAVLAVVADLSDLAALETGTLVLETEAFGLRTELDEISASFAARADAAGLEFLVSVHPDTPDGLIGDPRRLRQVLGHLLANAIKFTPEGGEIVVRVAPATVERHAVALAFSVVDTGAGMPAAWQADLSLALEPSERTIGQGPGLGLAVCTRLVELMGGRLHIDANPDGGSALHFTAPFARQDDTPAHRPLAPIVVRDEPVLIVDGNATARTLLADTLRSWDALPTTVASGEAALAVLQGARRTGRPYRLVLIDAHLRGEDAFHMAELVLRRPALTDAVLMLVAPHDVATCTTQCQTLGLSGWIAKPVTEETLRRAITRALASPADTAQRPADRSDHRGRLLELRPPPAARTLRPDSIPLARIADQSPPRAVGARA